MTASTTLTWRAALLLAAAATLLSAAPASAGGGPAYRWDESRNPGGPNRCSNDAQCDGARVCSPSGWCQGTARPPQPSYGQPPGPPSVEMPPPGPLTRLQFQFFIQSKLNGQVLDIRDRNRSPGSPVVVFFPKGRWKGDEVWELVPSGLPSFFYIRNRMTGFVLDIAQADRTPGAPVIAFPPNPTPTDNQLWQLVPSSAPSYFFIRSRLNGFVLDISGANPAPATPVIAYPPKSGDADNQLWQITLAPPSGPVVAAPPSTTLPAPPMPAPNPRAFYCSVVAFDTKFESFGATQLEARQAAQSSCLGKYQEMFCRGVACEANR